jgi:WD40 repeat protein
MTDGEAQAVFSPAGDRLVTWSPAASGMYLWDAQTGKKIGRMSDHWKVIGQVKFSDDGAHILSAAKDERMIIWRATDGKVLKKLDSNGKDPLPAKVDFLAKSSRVLVYVAAEDATATKQQLLVWDWSTGAPVASVLADRIKLQSYFITPDDTKLFINAADNSVHVYDLLSLKRLHTVVGMRVLSLSADGKFVYAANKEGVRIFDAHNLAPIARLPDQVAVFESPPESPLLATTSADGTLSLWNRQSGESYGTLEGHADAVSTVLFSSNARRIVSISVDNKALIWALPDILDMHKLVKDPFETTADFMKRMNDWTSPFTSLVELLSYNADTEVYKLQIGDAQFDMPYERSKAKLLSGQKQAKLAGKLKFLDAEQLIVESPQLHRLQ